MSYCINIKKRKNKPYCKIRNEEITFSQCRECSNKEYKKNSANNCKQLQKTAKKTQCIKRKKSDFRSKSPLASELSNNSQISKNAQSLKEITPKKVKLRKKSNKLANLERNRYSVFTDNLDICYLCGRKKNDLHEVYAGRNRINSIKYGFVLPICRECHSLNQNNPFFNDYWHIQGQLYWEKNIGSREEFIKVFMRNYLK